MSTPHSDFSRARSGRLSVAVISPDRRRRIAAASALAQCACVQTRESDSYPADAEEAALMLDRGFDAILIDLDGNEAVALQIVEALCLARRAMVMVFSANASPELILRGMRAGAREFLNMPFEHQAVEKALAWVAAHRPATEAAKTSEGKLHVFFGSKGGVGVTTVASNFAVALAEASKKSTLLIDLNLSLGDAAMNLGIGSEHAAYSAVDALDFASELDGSLLFKLLAHHSSGLAVLAAPLDLPRSNPRNAAIGRLLAVARQNFDYVVVDAGKKVDLQQMHLFEESATAYLVTQVGIPELRNANRLIAQFARDHSPTLEVVINRYQSRFLGLTDEHLTKALTQPVRWKVPNDFKAVREMQSSGTAVVYQNSTIGGVIREMVFAVCGKHAPVARAAEVEAHARGFRFPWGASNKAAKAAPKATELDTARAERNRAVVPKPTMLMPNAPRPRPLARDADQRLRRSYNPLSLELAERNNPAA